MRSPCCVCVSVCVFFLFIYGTFNDVVSSSDRTASNGTVVSK
jgi:hypothetical protein